MNDQVRAHLSAAAICILCACVGARDSADVRLQRSEPAGIALAAAIDEVRSIQLYGANQEDLPILNMQTGHRLTLEFDLLDAQPKALSVYFYHADRSWRRDLDPAEYLNVFYRDDIFDYSMSLATTVGYTHYAYSFPNGNIDFRLSGNYVLRVTEHGQENEILFERPFAVVENMVPVRFALERLLTGRQVLPTVQPLVRFTPPNELRGSAFDYSVCFARDGVIHARCTNRPSLADQPSLLFYLEPEMSFAPQEGDYYLDIRELNTGVQIEYIDRAVLPIAVTLAPDYARFPAGTWQPLLAGQSVIGLYGPDAGITDVQGEYVEVLFRYVPPDDAPLPGGLFMVGSFNGWNLDLGNELRWIAAEGWYEQTVLLKQGQYEYRYTSPDPRVRSKISTRVPATSSLYTALIYFRDTGAATDRLLGFAQVRSN